MAGRVSCVYAYLSTSILSPNFNSTEQLMFLQKSEYLTTALFRNTMLRTTTKQSYQDSCSCRCRKNSFAGHTLKQKVEKPRESTVASNALSSIVYCGKCEDIFRRVGWKARGASYNKWRCASRIEKGPKKGCDVDAISETEIQNAVVRAINKTLGGRERFLVQLQHNIEDVLNGDSTATLEYIDQRMAELQEKLVMCVNKNAEYDVIVNEIDALREKKAAVVTKDAEQEMLKKRIEEM